MKRKNYLILLTETERSMVEEALTHYVQNPFLGSGNWVSIDAREKVREKTIEFLDIIKSFNGGIRKAVSEHNLHFLQSAFNWYGNFIPRGEEMNEYTKLGYVITGRNENQHLLDFDPNAYNPKEKKEIRKKDFSQIRYLIAREVKGEIDYVSEIIQKEKETEAEYEKRAKKELKKQEGNHTGLWMLIKNTDLPNLKIGKKCGYFCLSPSMY
jgi:hypothetical protein